MNTSAITPNLYAILFVILVRATLSCGQGTPPLAAPTNQPDLYHEQYRPQFHFNAAKGWLNDPNGLVFFDGEYPLFFQHRPDALTQTPVMSWGHAVSPDLVHWTQLPIALAPD